MARVLVSLGWATQYSNYQKTKKDTPPILIKEGSPVETNSVKKPLTKRKLVDNKIAKKLHFSLEVKKVVRVQRTRVATKR